MAKQSISATCWGTSKCGVRMTRSKLVFLILLSVSMAACGPERRTVGLDVDVFLHPGSSDLSDVLLQTGIAKRLADDQETQRGIIHVRVVNLMVILSGAVGNQDMKARAQRIAEETVVKLNEVPIQTKVEVSNRIEVQR
jgi:osmotically-inducible protein OsmY